jgi:hypothetical protein
VALTNEGGATTLRHDSIVVKGPPWPAAASEVMGGRRSGGGGTQAGRFAWIGGDGTGALDGFNVVAGENKSEGESARLIV